MPEEKKEMGKNNKKKPEVKELASFEINKGSEAEISEKNGLGSSEKLLREKPGNRGKRKMRRNRKEGRDDRRDEFEQRVLDIARVTRVMAGGKRMSFRACVAIGDKKGKVGMGLGKGADVAMAVNKAVNKAKKNLIEVSTVNETIPHEIYCKAGAAKILFKPARRGRGVIAGGVVRVILELAGIHNVSAKILGTNNKINNARCTIEALKRIKRVEVKNKESKEDKKIITTKAGDKDEN